MRRAAKNRSAGTSSSPILPTTLADHQHHHAPPLHHGPSSSSTLTSRSPAKISSLDSVTPSANGGSLPSTSSSTALPHNPNNSFLMGGQYYPGKDKKRFLAVRRKRRAGFHFSFPAVNPLSRLYQCCQEWALHPPAGSHQDDDDDDNEESRGGRSSRRARRRWPSYRRRRILATLVMALVMTLVLVFQSWKSGHPTSRKRSSWSWWWSHHRPYYFERQQDGASSYTELTLRDPSLQAVLASRPLRLDRQVARHLDLAAVGLDRSRRFQLLEALAPAWYHRFDLAYHPVTTHGDDQEVAEAAETEEKEVETEERSKDTDTVVDQDPTDDTDESPHTMRTASRHLRTLHNMLQWANMSQCPTDLADEDIQITWVVQSTVSRLWVLRETCRRWSGPMVAAVADPSPDLEAQLRYRDEWQRVCPQLHLIWHSLEAHEAAPEQYPVNRLRNLALDAVHTSHVLVVDVDFVPSDGLYSTLQSTLREQRRIRQDYPSIMQNIDENRHTLVVPAFERVVDPPCTDERDCQRHLENNSSFIPHTFSDLQDAVQRGDCIVFQGKNNPPGHSSTRSYEWLHRQWYQHHSVEMANGLNQTVDAPRSVDCFDSLRYEPYVVIRWCPSHHQPPSQPLEPRPGAPVVPGPVAPYYDERFHGYGKNKIEHVQHLRLMGYRFAVLPGGFIVHNPHVESLVKQSWNDLDTHPLHQDMDQLYMTFLHELVDLYAESMHKSGIVDAC